MEKIKKLRLLIKKEEIDGYLTPKNDEFFNEYVSDKSDRLNYISGFSGSYGYCLILKKKNYLFVDGRYTLQAIKQSGKFFKIITIPDKMPKDILKDKKLLIGFDPKLFNKKSLHIFFKNSKCMFKPLSNNLIDKIWRRKMSINKKKFYLLPDRHVGNNHKLKIKKVISSLKNKNADYLFVTASENGAWLLNMRGNDSKYSPIPNCFVLVRRNKEIKIFCDMKKISVSLKKSLKNVKFINISLIAKHLSNISGKKFVVDGNTCSVYLENIILKNNIILSFQDPINNFKSIKTKTEIDNIKRAHIYDGASLTKYLFWVKKNFYKKRITEISGTNKLLELRKNNNKFKFSSFPTISGTGPNGAIIHYKASKKSNRILRKGDIYLVDSGGQYEFGTTDVTRTISLKNSNKRIKNIFTRVLKGHIAVASFKLKKNTSGAKIDSHARKYLKMIGLNYSHGTGHGVGYFLNVHEGPHAISKNNKVVFQEGMVMSNEPGYYEKNKFGIRIENLIYVKKDKNKKKFENLTMVPIDKELIDKKILNYSEKKWLNEYHQKVFNCLKESMNNSEILELKKACSAI